MFLLSIRYLNDGSIFLSQLSPANWYLILPPFSQSVRSFIIASSKLSFHEHNFLWTELEVTHSPILASLSISYEFKHTKLKKNTVVGIKKMDNNNKFFKINIRFRKHE